MKVAILTNKKKNYYISDLNEVVSTLFKNGVEVLMCKDNHIGLIDYNITWFENEESIVGLADFVIVIGGDGTIIRYAKIATKYDKPVIGINTGRLGFVSSIEKTEINVLSTILKEKYFVDERILFEISTGNDKYDNLALNDTIISRGATSQIIDYNVFRGKLEVCSFRADGVIISTPTGSTAYSMSAGGPIVAPNVECAIITPICAHTLNSRPIILDLKEQIYIKYSMREGSDVYVMCDGNEILNSNTNGEVGIRKSKLNVKFIQADEGRFYKNVRLKLIR